MPLFLSLVSTFGIRDWQIERFPNEDFLILRFPRRTSNNSTRPSLVDSRSNGLQSEKKSEPRIRWARSRVCTQIPVRLSVGRKVPIKMQIPCHRADQLARQHSWTVLFTRQERKLKRGGHTRSRDEVDADLRGCARHRETGRSYIINTGSLYSFDHGRARLWKPPSSFLTPLNSFITLFSLITRILVISPKMIKKFDQIETSICTTDLYDLRIRTFAPRNQPDYHFSTCKSTPTC